MTEPENIEEDLFADLSVPDPLVGHLAGASPAYVLTCRSYDDNEPSAAPAPAPAKTESVPEPTAHEASAFDDGPAHDHHSYGNDHQEPNYDDDDDDVDFNLGNGPPPKEVETVPVKEEVSTPTFHSARGPSAKEDG